MGILYLFKGAGEIKAICLGERHAHVSPGKFLNNSHWRGSWIWNWHGGPHGSLEDLADWVLEAEHPELEDLLWEGFSTRKTPEAHIVVEKLRTQELAKWKVKREGQKLEALIEENAKLKALNARLEEYKYMYEGLEK